MSCTRKSIFVRGLFRAKSRAKWLMPTVDTDEYLHVDPQVYKGWENQRCFCSEGFINGYTTYIYIPLIYCLLGGLYATYHLLGEPETTIDFRILWGEWGCFTWDDLKTAWAVPACNRGVFCLSGRFDSKKESHAIVVLGSDR